MALPKDLAGRDEKIKQISDIISETFPKVFEHVRPFPEVESVLKNLKKRAFKVGAVTSSWGSVFRPLESHSLAHYFDVFISRDDGFRLKPAPDSILECLKRMEVAPGSALTVGDSPVDIRAGKAAGTLTIGVLSGIGTREQLEAEGPSAILEGIADLLPLLDKE